MCNKTFRGETMERCPRCTSPLSVGIDLLDMLSDNSVGTGEGTAAELAARFDIDIRKGSFWEGSLKLIEERIERYVSLEQ